MRNRYVNCCNDTNNRTIAKRANGKRFTLQNPRRKHVCVIEADTCLASQGQLRCDYIFHVRDESEKVIFVELKGRDVEHATKQICDTVSYCEPAQRNCNDKEGWIVAAGSPKVSAKRQQLILSAYRKHNVKLSFATDRKEIII